MGQRKVLLAVAIAVAIVAAAGAGVAFVGFPGRGSVRAGASDIGGPFTLVDDRGAPVSEAALKGKPTVMYFGYTFCPEVCPTTLTDLSHWMRLLGADADKLSYVFVTVDPERDTPKVMHDYVSAFDARIRGFTGTPDQIAKVAAEYRVYYRRIPTSDGDYVMDHSAILYLLDSSGRFFGVIAYQEDTAKAVAKLKKLVALAASS